MVKHCSYKGQNGLNKNGGMMVFSICPQPLANTMVRDVQCFLYSLLLRKENIIKVNKYLKRLNVICGSEMFLFSQYYNSRLYNIGTRVNNNKHNKTLIYPHGLFYAFCGLNG